mmetsp:Transcript_152159/g.269888  ORF Transcript_152159/g.269888 Transcript_152159/m.269888 type:complete len:676 (+) Transcript_152159:71-2098(+)
MTAQLKEIVDRLNVEPFNMGLSLVAFDEKEPFELMEVLNTVLTQIDPLREVNLRDEQPDVVCQNIMEFVTVLGYKRPFDMEAQQGLLAGDKYTVHPILHWLLQNFEALKKRAYLAKYCVNLEVPEEFLRDEQVYEVFQNYKELQSQFKATHMHVEHERQGRMDPTGMTAEVTQLEAEREQLAQKIQRLRMKSEKDEGFQMLLQVTSMLRKEQEEEARLAEKLEEQRHQLERVEQYYLERMSRLREMRAAQDADSENSPDAMLKLLRNEVVKMREGRARLHREIEEKAARLMEIDKALSEPPVTEADVGELEGEVGSMQEEVQRLTQIIEEHNQDKRLAVYRQQAGLVAKKKEQVLKEQAGLGEDRNTLGRDLSQKEREYEIAKGHKFMSRNEFKSYAASLRERSVRFKRLKAELGDLRNENAILTRTEQILKAQDPTPQNMPEIEQRLEKASVEKAKVDRAKGRTLDEISNIVQQINSQLKEKKNKLAPQIKALRSARQNFQTLEAKHNDKKSAYDQVRLSTEADLKRISDDVQRLEGEASEAERNYHDLHMQLALADSQLHRASTEARRLRNEERLSDQYASLSERYESEIGNLDRMCKDLRKEQKVVKESHTDNLKQKKNFGLLEGLMRVKLKCAQQEALSLATGGMPGGFYGAGQPPVTDMSTAGVERLVIE